jgi:phosphoserine phosphatase
MIAAESKSHTAAFLDLDGTVLPLPSLERRFVSMLRYQHAIPAQNYFRWLAETLRLAPRGIRAITHANKTYLCNISASMATVCSGRTDSSVSPESRRAGGPVRQNAAASSSATLNRFPAFFPDALERAAWHATQRHTIVLVTGTLEPLAKQAALALTLRLLVRGITASVGVCATRLEESKGRWTGLITGEAMFGEAKARALQRIAASSGFDLARSYAYGDATGDRWMLGAVGRPAAVNPSRELERIARLRNWPIFLWKENESQHATAATRPEDSRGTDCGVIPKVRRETWG